ncbi:MAG: hypothetical protein RL641_436 [Candidatus Parcubacteria bacterium]|jgi:hypothetical protein
MPNNNKIDLDEITKLLIVDDGINNANTQRNNIDLNEINRYLSQSYSYYDDEQKYYKLTSTEFELMKDNNSHVWEVWFYAMLFLCISSFFNGLADYINHNVPTNEAVIYFNFIFFGISLSLALLCRIMWMKVRKRQEQLINKIEKKPHYKLVST